MAKQTKTSEEDNLNRIGVEESSLLNARSMDLAQAIQRGVDSVFIQFDTQDEAKAFRQDWYRFRVFLKRLGIAGQFERVFSVEARVLDGGVELTYRKREKSAFARACQRAIKELTELKDRKARE